MATPNLANISIAYGNTIVQSVTTASANIIVNSAASGTLIKVRTLSMANRGNATANVSVNFVRSGVVYDLANGISVPSQSTFIAIGKDNEYYLLEGDSIRVSASSNVIDAAAVFETVS
jgi:hypothetical protein